MASKRIWMQPAGLAVAHNMPIEEVAWRVKIRRLRGSNFDDEAKQTFLASLQRHGKTGMACLDAGVSPAMLKLAKENDEEFRDACELTIQVFKDRRVHKLELEAMRGHDEPIYGSMGQEGVRTRYESGLRAMILKAHCPEMYADKQELNVNHNVGAVVVPALLGNDEWEAQFAEHNSKFEALLTTGESVPDSPPGVVPSELPRNSQNG